jgi:hypothetical protein
MATAADHHKIQYYPRERTAFLYDRAGPWPQPAPDHPMAMAAEVLHPTQEEQDDWSRHAGRSYLKTMLTSIPRAAYTALTRGRVQDISDEVFTELLTTTIYSKYLRRTDAEEARSLFEGVSFDAGADLYTIDFTPVQDIVPYDGMWISPTITLFVRSGSAWGAAAIRIGRLLGEGDGRRWDYLVVNPTHVEAWTLSKYFVLQGASHVTTLSGHPATHFPWDTVNAITTSALPTDHTLFQLLFPHLRLALAVNHAVLEGSHSVVSETRGEIYAPYCAPGASVRVLVAAGYVGYPHYLSTYAPSETPGAAYPKWVYPLVPRALDIPSDFGRVLRAYHETITAFVRVVVDDLLARRDTPKGAEEVHYLKRWAHYISEWLPGFPDSDEILGPGESGDNLVAAVAAYIWDVSVAHSLDHRSFYRLHPRRTPFRIRVPPPASTSIEAVNHRRILNGWDLFKATLAFDMFFQPHNVALLKDVEYAFGTEKLQDAARDFREALVATEKRLSTEVNVENYIPLAEIATSIQY